MISSIGPSTRTQQAKVAHALIATLLVIASALSMAMLKQSNLDDPYISYRYGKNFNQGNGLRWNPGEAPVEGYTNFAWVLVGAAAQATGHNPALSTRVIGAISVVGMILLVFSPLNRVVTSLSGRTLVGAAVGLSPVVCFYAVSGMETAFFGLLVFGGSLVATRAMQDGSGRRFVISGLLFGLSVLTRPEGVLLFLSAFLIILGWPRGRGLIGNSRRKNLIQFGAPFALLCLGHCGWRLYYYSALVPNTYLAKYSGNGVAEHALGLVYFAEGLKNYLCVPAVGAAVIGWRQRKDRPEMYTAETAFLLLSVGIYLVYMLIIGRDDVAAFPSARFVAPIIPNAYIVLASLIERAELGRRATRATMAALVVVAVLVFVPDQVALARVGGRPWPGGWPNAQIVQWLFGFPNGFFDKPKLATWIEATTGTHALIAVPWAGRIPFFVERPFLDTLGLNDSHIARRPKTQRGVDVKTDPDYVLSRQPTLIFINVQKAAALGDLSFEAAGGWKMGDRILLERLLRDPRYSLDLAAPSEIAVFRRVGE